MSLLDSLALGLRQAGGVLNPKVQEMTARQDELQTNLAERRRDLMAQQTIEAIKSGAMEPEAGKTLLQRMGYGGMAVGPGIEAQTRADSLENQRKYKAAIAALGPNATPDEQLAAARPFMDAQHLAQMVQTAQTRKDTIENTKQVALARLAQTATQAEQTHQYRLSTLTRQQDRDAEIKRHNLIREAIDNEALSIAGKRLFYDTGLGTGNPPIQTPLSPVPPQQPDANVAPAPTQSAPQPDNTLRDLLNRPDIVGQPQFVKDNLARAYAATTRGEQFRLADNYAPSSADREIARLPASANQTQAAPAPQASTPMAIPAASIVNGGNQAPKLSDAPSDLSPRDKARWLLQQTRPSIAGSGVLTPEALEFTAKQYLSGDRQAAQGYARNATARIALQNAIVDEAKKQGLTPEATAAKMAEFAGTMSGSRTVGQRAANINLAATEAGEMISIVKEQSDKFGRTNFVPFNMALKAYETNTGSPEIAAFGASINALVNVYARAINPTGVPTVSDKEHARAVLNAVQSPAQVDAVLGIIGRELDIAKRAPQTVREGIRSSVTGGSQSTEQNIVTLPNGKQMSFPDAEKANAFRKRVGL